MAYDNEYDQQDEWPPQGWEPPKSYTMEYADTPNGKPNTNTGSPGSKTEAINSQWKAWGDPWVDTGDTGGSLNGVTTIKQGSSLTADQQKAFRAQAERAGISADWLNNFDKLNPDDQSRYLSAYQSELGGGSNNRTGGAGGFGGSGSGSDALSAFLAYLQGKDAQESSWKSSIREMLMNQLKQYEKPVSADDPGIASVLGARRLQSQRAAERARLMAAEQYSSQGLGRSGALNTKLEGIDQARGESDTQATGQILYQELNNRRNALQSLLGAAIASGDSATAQLLQSQLSAIQMQLQNSQFNDRLGYDYNALNSGLNSNALLALLNR